MDITIANVKRLIKDGFTQKQIAEEFDISPSGLRYWLKKYNLKTNYMVDRRTWTDDMLIEAVSKSISIADVIRNIGLSLRPGNYPTINKVIKRLDLDISHFKGKSHGNGGIVYELEDVMIRNSPYSRTSLKRRLLKCNMIENICDICGIGEWNNKPIVMVLDHINGINNDHRRENLRMICPNCNSQQNTFCRRNKNGGIAQR